MLNGVLALHDVPDVEALTRKVLRDRCHHNGRGLGKAIPHHLEEAIIDDLILLAWKLSGLNGDLRPITPRPERTWNPALTPSFRTYITTILHLRVPDSYRHHIHDTRAPKPHLDSLDALAALDTESDTSPLERALAASTADPQEHRSTDLSRALLQRNSRTPEHHPQDDRQAHARAA